MPSPLDESEYVLSQREETVLRIRSGELDPKDYKLESIGLDFNITRERIRQIESKALQKRKHPSLMSRFHNACKDKDAKD